jgi:hypothetical protein
LKTKQINYLSDIGQEKDFELSAVEFLDIKTVTVCIYRSPESDLDEFLAKLEIVIRRIQEKKGLSFVVIGMRIFFTAIQNCTKYKMYWKCII